MIKNIRYSIVTPARNEEAILDRTVQSVINQTIKPQKWVIINDGSTDRTGEILDSYSKKHKWINVIHVEKKFPSFTGGQEMLGRAFERINLEQNDFVGKLDADIELAPIYYEDILGKFYDDPKLGIAGGTLFHFIKGKKIIENNPENHVRGGLKLYRIQCWRDIGGMEFKLGFDTIDEIKAIMLGWKTKNYRNIEALHQRPTQGVAKWHLYGKIAYLVGYHPVFLICKCLKNMVTLRPYLLGGVAELAGFLECYLNRTERTISDQEFIKFLRKMQIRRLLNRRSYFP